jgi:phosphoribosyl-ATP pyrophosphohydrolase/phosphoribosyl-AMP cyclohydrolase
MIDAATLFSRLRPGPDGLVPAVVAHADDHRHLMLGYVNEASLAETMRSGHVTFWSRSKGRLWTKGESSGHFLDVREIRVDCDEDALLIFAIPHGPTCHTGRTSCFYRKVEGEDFDTLPIDDGPVPAVSVLEATMQVIEARKRGELGASASGKSYVRGLLDKGVGRTGEKLVEEAGELATALADESDERVASEAADLMFHALVGLAARGLDLRHVEAVLAARHGLSGIDERRARGKSDDV